MNTITTPQPLPAHIDRLYQKSLDSWWVFRHGVDPQGAPLPFCRVVYYASCEADARRWLDSRAACAPTV